MEFKCRVCFVVHPLAMAKVDSYAPNTGMGKCKPCHSDYVTKYKREQIAKVKPDKFFSCMKCFDVFYKQERQRGRQPLDRKPVFRTECPTCKTKDIRSYE